MRRGIGKPRDEANDMSDYYPRGRHMSTSGFEMAIPCELEKR
jgi:hypothetical protein